MKEYYITDSDKFQAEWEKKFLVLWSELTFKEQCSLIPIQPPYTEESVVEFLAKLRTIKESRSLSFPSLFQKQKKQIPFPTSGVLYWQMVEIPGKNYFIGKYPVTQALWERVMGNNPSDYKGRSRPVECVNWFECVAFCNKLSEMEGLEKAYLIHGEEVQCTFDADGYRLPTDWEWYYAAKANQDFIYSGSNDIDEVAWYAELGSSRTTHVVGQKKANGFGLYDMSGNVWEWCWNRWEDNQYYIGGPVEGSTGSPRGDLRLLRGGSCDYDAQSSRVSYEGRSRPLRVSPSYRGSDKGFRLCRAIR